MYCHKHLQTGLTIGLTYGILCIVDGGENHPRIPGQDEKGGGMKEDMTRLELLTLLLSIKALLESDNKEKALELIDEVIKEAKK